MHQVVVNIVPFFGPTVWGQLMRPLARRIDIKQMFYLASKAHGEIDSAGVIDLRRSGEVYSQNERQVAISRFPVGGVFKDLVGGFIAAIEISEYPVSVGDYPGVGLFKYVLDRAAQGRAKCYHDNGGDKQFEYYPIHRASSCYYFIIADILTIIGRMSIKSEGITGLISTRSI